MKKTILIAAFAIFGFTSVQAQEGTFSIGANGGIPVGDFENYFSLNLGADVAYRFGLSEKFEVGALAAYSHFFGESGTEDGFEFEVEDGQFLPLAASARFNVQSFFVGGDIGYALGLNDGNEGGFYYRPHVGYNFGKLGVIASYAGISNDDFKLATLNLGIEFRL